MNLPASDDLSASVLSGGASGAGSGAAGAGGGADGESTGGGGGGSGFEPNPHLRKRKVHGPERKSARASAEAASIDTALTHINGSDASAAHKYVLLTRDGVFSSFLLLFFSFCFFVCFLLMQMVLFLLLLLLLPLFLLLLVFAVWICRSHCPVAQGRSEGRPFRSVTCSFCTPKWSSSECSTSKTSAF
jgi:hypothetical protein